MFVLQVSGSQLVAEYTLRDTKLLQGVRNALCASNTFCRLNNKMIGIEMYSAQMYVFVINE